MTIFGKYFSNGKDGDQSLLFSLCFCSTFKMVEKAVSVSFSVQGNLLLFQISNFSTEYFYFSSELFLTVLCIGEIFFSNYETVNSTQIDRDVPSQPVQFVAVQGYFKEKTCFFVMLHIFGAYWRVEYES